MKNSPLRNWTYGLHSVTSTADMPNGAIGFVYCITVNDKKYIGKKSLYSRRKRKFGKKEIAKITDKRKKLWEYVVKESDWKTYCSSNKEVKELMKFEVGDRAILAYAYSKKELSYLEEKHQYQYSVLESDAYYNDNIAGRYFKEDFIKPPQK
jgi:hypothetical protein